MWVYPSNIRDFIMDNALETVLKYHHRTKHTRGNPNNMYGPVTFLDYIREKGISFEHRIIELLSSRLPQSADLYICDNAIPVDEQISKTLYLMEQEQPLIFQGYVESIEYGIRGIPDLIVRGSHLKYLTDGRLYGTVKSATYYIVDIKFSSLRISPTESGYIYNTGSVLSFKAQVGMYTLCINEMMKQHADIAFLLGRRTVCAVASSAIRKDYGQCFEQLGPVYLSDIDHHVVQKALNGVKWFKWMLTDGHNWEIDPPDYTVHPELFPNLNQSASGKFAAFIAEIAKKNKDTSLIWNIGQKRRQILLQNGITRWDDPKLTASVLNLKGTIGTVMNHILETNRTKSDISPSKIVDNYRGWQDTPEKWNTMDFYVDFEVTTSAFDDLTELPSAKDDSFIFMIGIGYIIDNKWNYICLSATELSIASEFDLTRNFVNVLRTICKDHGIDAVVNPPRLFHWGSAELKWIRRTSKRAKSSFSKHEYREWGRILSGLFDLSEVMQEIPVAINGCLNYKLKSFTSALEHYGLRRYMQSVCKHTPYDKHVSLWNSDSGGISDGVTAMYYCWTLYQDPELSANDIMYRLRKVIDYNELDCFSVCSIHQFLVNVRGLGYSEIKAILYADDVIDESSDENNCDSAASSTLDESISVDSDEELLD